MNKINKRIVSEHGISEDEFKLIKNVKKHLNLQIDCGIVELFETFIENKDINFRGRKRIMDICRDWNLLNNTNTLEEFLQ